MPFLASQLNLALGDPGGGFSSLYVFRHDCILSKAILASLMRSVNHKQETSMKLTPASVHLSELDYADSDSLNVPCDPLSSSSINFGRCYLRLGCGVFLFTEKSIVLPVVYLHVIYDMLSYEVSFVS